MVSQVAIGIMEAQLQEILELGIAEYNLLKEKNAETSTR